MELKVIKNIPIKPHYTLILEYMLGDLVVSGIQASIDFNESDEDIKNFIYKVDKSNFSKFCSIIFLSYYNFLLQLVDQESQPGYGINL